MIGRRPIPGVTGIYNSAVVPFEGAFIGVFRTEGMDRMPHLHVGRSPDGFAWTFERTPIALRSEDSEITRHEYGYDPRVTRIGDDHYVTWCNGYHGPTIGVARTRDFQHFEQLENASLPYNRNGVLFPRKIDGKFAMLSRPSDTGHTPFGDIFYSDSPDMMYWGHHRHVMSRGGQWWQGAKIGAGPSPIETSEGWLLFYHGVMSICNGFSYSMGAVLLRPRRTVLSSSWGQSSLYHCSTQKLPRTGGVGSRSLTFRSVAFATPRIRRATLFVASC